MERVHFNAIQQLQVELAKAGEVNGTHKEESSTEDAPHGGHDNGHHDADGSVPSNKKSHHGTKENTTNTFIVDNASQVCSNLVNL